MAAKKGGSSKRSGEWVGGTFPFPGVIDGEERSEPHVVVWLNAAGGVLGHTVGPRAEIASMLASSLRDAIERPLLGAPHRPERVRVASEELADAVRAAEPAIEVVCAPTPEVERMHAAMRERMHSDVEGSHSFLAPGVDAPRVGAFFRAAARLFRAAPWSVVPDFQHVFAVTVPSANVLGLDVHDFVLAVLGPSDVSRGSIYLFPTFEDYDGYLVAMSAMDRGEPYEHPPLLMLVFVSPTALPTPMRDEVAEHGWEVADADAVPELLIAGEAGARSPTAEELSLVEAVALALPDVVDDAQALLNAWDVGAPVVRTQMVATHAGEREVTIVAPYEEVPDGALPEDLLGALADLESDEEIDPEARTELEKALLRRLLASPEGAALKSVECVRVVSDTAADFLGVTIATMTAAELREVLFEIVPRQVTIDPAAAGAIVIQTRALYAFLGRELGLEQAPACLAVLDGEAEQKLAAALSDPTKFGMAKQIIALGRAGGFDLDSPEGVAAWMRELESRPLPPSIRLPGDRAPRPGPSRQKQTAKKAQRKATRKARKKNR